MFLTPEEGLLCKELALGVGPIPLFDALGIVHRLAYLPLVNNVSVVGLVSGVEYRLPVAHVNLFNALG